MTLSEREPFKRIRVRKRGIELMTVISDILVTVNETSFLWV
jgi:hypothetical protein